MDRYYFVAYESINDDGEMQAHNDIIYGMHPLVWMGQQCLRRGVLGLIGDGMRMLFWEEIPEEVVCDQSVLRLPYTTSKRFENTGKPHP